MLLVVALRLFVPIDTAIYRWVITLALPILLAVAFIWLVTSWRRRWTVREWYFSSSSPLRSP